MMESAGFGSHDDGSHWNCFAQLPARPHRRGVRRDVDVQDTSAFVGEDDEDEQHATTKGRHGEEVERHTRADGTPEEGAPRLGRRPPTGRDRRVQYQRTAGLGRVRRDRASCCRRARFSSASVRCPPATTVRR